MDHIEPLTLACTTVRNPIVPAQKKVAWGYASIYLKFTTVDWSSTGYILPVTQH